MSILRTSDAVNAYSDNDSLGSQKLLAAVELILEGNTIVKSVNIVLLFLDTVGKVSMAENSFTYTLSIGLALDSEKVLDMPPSLRKDLELGVYGPKRIQEAYKKVIYNSIVSANEDSPSGVELVITYINTSDLARNK